MVMVVVVGWCIRWLYVYGGDGGDGGGGGAVTIATALLCQFSISSDEPCSSTSHQLMSSP